MAAPGDRTQDHIAQASTNSLHCRDEDIADDGVAVFGAISIHARSIAGPGLWRDGVKSRTAGALRRFQVAAGSAGFHSASASALPAGPKAVLTVTLCRAKSTAARHPESRSCRARFFAVRIGQALVYFSSVECVNCQRPARFHPRGARHGGILRPGGWLAAALWWIRRCRRYCANAQNACACTWLVRSDDASALCLSCRLTATIPDQNYADNQQAWRDLEAQAQLAGDGAGFAPACALAQRGSRAWPELSFPAPGRFLAPGIDRHAAGEITINAVESDPVQRARSKQALMDPIEPCSVTSGMNPGTITGIT